MPLRSRSRTVAPRTLTLSTGDWTAWGVDAFNTRFKPDPGLTAADMPKLKLKWAFGVPDATVVRSQPAVARGRVVFGTQEGTVYSLDAASGSFRWATEFP